MSTAMSVAPRAHTPSRTADASKAPPASDAFGAPDAQVTTPRTPADAFPVTHAFLLDADRYRLWVPHPRTGVLRPSRSHGAVVLPAALRASLAREIRDGLPSPFLRRLLRRSGFDTALIAATFARIQDEIARRQAIPHDDVLAAIRDLFKRGRLPHTRATAELLRSLMDVWPVSDPATTGGPRWSSEAHRVRRLLVDVLPHITDVSSDTLAVIGQRLIYIEDHWSLGVVLSHPQATAEVWLSAFHPPRRTWYRQGLQTLMRCDRGRSDPRVVAALWREAIVPFRPVPHGDARSFPELFCGDVTLAEHCLLHVPRALQLRAVTRLCALWEGAGVHVALGLLLRDPSLAHDPGFTPIAAHIDAQIATKIVSEDVDVRQSAFALLGVLTELSVSSTTRTRSADDERRPTNAREPITPDDLPTLDVAHILEDRALAFDHLPRDPMSADLAARRLALVSSLLDDDRLPF